MSKVQTRSLVRYLYEEAFDRGNLAVVDEVYAPEYAAESLPLNVAHSREGIKQGIAMLRTAFPDLHYTVEDEIEQGDKIAARWSMRGTHQGPFMGSAATGKSVNGQGVFYGRVANGKLVEGWVFTDNFSLMQQLGIVPPPRANS